MMSQSMFKKEENSCSVALEQSQSLHVTEPENVEADMQKSFVTVKVSRSRSNSSGKYESSTTVPLAIQ